MTDRSSLAVPLAAALVELAALRPASVGLLTCANADAARLVAASDDGCRLLLEHEVRLGEGPGLSAIRTAGWVADDDLGSTAPGVDRDRWAAWRPLAVAAGWLSVVAVPLIPIGMHNEPPIGAMVLPDCSRGPLTLPDRAWVLALAAVATAGLAEHVALRQERQLTERLQQALDSRVVIEQAKGVLVERGGLDPATAFDRLRRYARTHRSPLAEVARQVLEGGLADDVLTHARPLLGPGQD